MAASANPCICSSRAKVKARHYPSRCRRLNKRFLYPVFRAQGEKRKQMSQRDRRRNQAADRREGAGQSGAGGNDKPAKSLSGVDGMAPVYQLPVTRRPGRPLVLSLPAIWFITGHGDTNVHTASPDNLREHK